MPVFDYDSYTGNSDYISWDQPGDQVVGTIKEIREGTDFNNNACPELVLEVNDDGDEMTLTAGQAMLKQLLAEQRPTVGQRIRITYTGDERTDRGGIKKLFTLETKEGTGLIQAEVSNSTEPF